MLKTFLRTDEFRSGKDLYKQADAGGDVYLH